MLVLKNKQNQSRLLHSKIFNTFSVKVLSAYFKISEVSILKVTACFNYNTLVLHIHKTIPTKAVVHSTGIDPVLSKPRS